MQLPPFSKEPQLPCLLFWHIFHLRPNEVLIQYLMPILRLLEVNTRRNPSPIIRLEQFMRRLPQGEPILELGPLSLMLCNLRGREMIRTFLGQTQLLPVLKEFDQTVANGEYAVSIRISAERKEFPDCDIRLREI